MRKENLNAHYACIASRYGITNINSFVRSARRYECKLNYLFTLVCNDEKRYKIAQREAEKVSESARKNLAKYCRNYKLFNNELFINQDPRGYALKLNVKKVTAKFLCKVDRDFGRDFILAPETTK
jgi:hypothetical protein